MYVNGNIFAKATCWVRMGKSIGWLTWLRRQHFTFILRLMVIHLSLSPMKFNFWSHQAEQKSRRCSPVELWYCVTFISMLLDTQHGKTISSHSSDFQTFKSKDSLLFHTDVHYCIELQKEKSDVMVFFEKHYGHLYNICRW